MFRLRHLRLVIVTGTGSAVVAAVRSPSIPTSPVEGMRCLRAIDSSHLLIYRWTIYSPTSFIVIFGPLRHDHIGSKTVEGVLGMNVVHGRLFYHAANANNSSLPGVSWVVRWMVHRGCERVGLLFCQNSFFCRSKGAVLMQFTLSIYKERATWGNKV
jgi:hypothetical protein